MNDDLAHVRAQLAQVHGAVFGNLDNLKQTPGIVHEMALMQSEQRRTNEILNDVRAGLRKVTIILVTALVTAAVSGVLQAITRQYN